MVLEKPQSNTEQARTDSFASKCRFHGWKRSSHPSMSYLPILGNLCDTSECTCPSLSCLIKRVTFLVTGHLRKNQGGSFCYTLIFQGFQACVCISVGTPGRGSFRFYVLLGSLHSGDTRGIQQLNLLHCPAGGMYWSTVWVLRAHIKRNVCLYTMCPLHHLHPRITVLAHIALCVCIIVIVNPLSNL